MPLHCPPRVPSFTRLRRFPFVVGALGAAAFLATAIASTRTAPDTYPVADTATTSIATLQAARGALAASKPAVFSASRSAEMMSG